jgi:hypothetical protein
MKSLQIDAQAFWRLLKQFWYRGLPKRRKRRNKALWLLLSHV